MLKKGDTWPKEIDELIYIDKGLDTDSINYIKRTLTTKYEIKNNVLDY